MKKFTIQFILLILVIAGAVFFFQQNLDLSNLPFVPKQSVFKELEINGNKLKVEVADTQDKRSKGLGGREKLASGEGMLFVFPKQDRYPFWMKGLSFPLDFIWIRGGEIVDLLHNVQPPAPGQTDASLPIYQSIEEVDKVLEVTGGTVERLNIKVGDKVEGI
ncbi:MAG: hypothetical protein ACD_32C00048G0002 [uncultured bacterium]|uniref:DUF192 domain-containing protein n=1 Tax=Candidatus Daviesbacteria bacterium RIFCSPHIGHO2_01_FULL_40_11 TaxID=1797762 RepID=A0A1F5JKL4_9BACT|nr:MAG: hypothetical protein ACD_32C00048G0002 [uncultured bacterium]OGE29088.1 MAG: hypothetical protein A2867_01155 [Candidatus Daviesbacteria bacterium RIFCSPHIGHO2_01_FULL_40_11]OGE62875.1 MAG: hypothetical protein A2964_01235 [Candidatus Daviesbacteria bacterium RIFCSPLOWO2_01_FULL_40_27]